MKKPVPPPIVHLAEGQSFSRQPKPEWRVEPRETQYRILEHCNGVNTWQYLQFKYIYLVKKYWLFGPPIEESAWKYIPRFNYAIKWKITEAQQCPTSRSDTPDYDLPYGPELHYVNERPREFVARYPYIDDYFTKIQQCAKNTNITYLT